MLALSNRKQLTSSASTNRSVLRNQSHVNSAGLFSYFEERGLLSPQSVMRVHNVKDVNSRGLGLQGALKG